jgi:signal transduction histidine kinase
MVESLPLSIMASRPHPVLWFRRRPRATDLTIALIVAAIAVAGVVFNDPADTLPGYPIPRAANAFAVIIVAVGGLALIWRRIKPIPVLLVTVAMLILREKMHFISGADSIPPLIAAYTVGAYVESRRRVTWVAAGVLLIVAFVNIIDERLTSTSDYIASIIANTIIFATAFLLGDNIRQRRQRLADLQQRNAFLEREQGMLADRAVADERTRIARELHDVVAHSVSVMAIQAGGARRVVHTKPQLAEEALTVIEATARKTLEELRGLLGVLRTDHADQAHAPQPGIGDLTDLINGDPTLDVKLTVEGASALTPAMVDLSAYRIVQEALTNVRKHAGTTSAAVAVAIRYLPDSVEVEVVDDGRGAAANQTGGGHGLVGMRERAALCGGKLDAGPRPGGGWIVRATLPVAT